MGLLFSKHRSLHEFSTFGIGGPIRYFAEAKTESDMRAGILFAKRKKLPFLVIGKGSNCLFDDRGFDGVVLLNKMMGCKWSDSLVEVESGYSFPLLGVQSARKHLSGLEFASGIPASVGGAIFMNAGANGKETLDCVQSVRYLHEDGDVKDYKKEEISFGYRTSLFQSFRGVILSAIFSLIPEVPTARKLQLEIVEKRKQTQPLSEKSVGCVFRNPSSSQSAGYLIDQCGLKGIQVGGAKVSEIHANFIVNEGGATAKEVVALMEIVSSKVFEKMGVHLESEVRMISYDA